MPGTRQSCVTDLEDFAHDGRLHVEIRLVRNRDLPTPDHTREFQNAICRFAGLNGCALPAETRLSLLSTISNRESDLFEIKN